MNPLIPIQEMPFPGPAGSLYLRSALPPDGTPVVARLGIIHGYGDHSGRYANFMRWMAERGVACHAVDLRGQGKSAGRRGYVTRWDDYLDDLRAFVALEALKQRGRESLFLPQSERGSGPLSPARSEKGVLTPLFLLGHSHGGLVLSAGIIAGIGSDGSVAGCVLSSPFFRNRMRVPRSKLLLGRVMEPLVPWLQVPTGLRGEMMTADPEMVAQTLVDPLVTRIATPRWFFGQIKAQERVLENAGKFMLPLLVLIGDADPLADPAGGKLFYERARSTDKTIKVYPAFLHELLREKEREKVFGDVWGWMKSHIV